jgi:hypothetical protein
MSIIQDVFAKVQEKDSGQPEFLQAVKEVLNFPRTDGLQTPGVHQSQDL